MVRVHLAVEYGLDRIFEEVLVFLRTYLGAAALPLGLSFGAYLIPSLATHFVPQSGIEIVKTFAPYGFDKPTYGKAVATGAYAVVTSLVMGWLT